jgi:CRISPR/Cas system CMR-associated protein Cmr5 small subunit
MEKTRLAYRTFESLSQPHMCRVGFCDPQNEASLISRGILKPPAILPDNVYICKYGVIHTCSEFTCMAEGTCPVSGASMGYVNEYSNYDPLDPRTWEVNKDAKKPKRQNDAAEERIEYIIEELLYSQKRKKIHDKLYVQSQKLLKKEKTNYLKQCKNTREVNLIKLAMIITKHTQKNGMNYMLERDTVLVTKYTALILDIYERIKKISNKKVNVEAVTLACLYKMQQGGVQGLLEPDIYLARNLPELAHLHEFGFNKTRFTDGEKLILQII